MFKIDEQNRQNSTEGEPVVELPATEQPAEQVAPNLPEGAKEETKEQFEKLLEHNRQMAQRLEELEQKQQPQFTSVLDELRPQSNSFKNLSTAQVEDISQSLVDENGYIDQDLLNRKLKEANETKDRLMLAEERIERFEETQLIRDVHAKHKELDPYSADYNPEIREAVKLEVLRQLKRGYQDYEAAADKVKAEFKAKSSTQSQSEQAKVEEQKKVISQREQATTLTSGGKAPLSQVEHEDLEEGTRKGNTLSIGQRLQASGY